MTGPGAVMVGLAIGAGELVIWPWITAKFGAVMVWAAALGVFLQLWVNIEIGRWAVATGESLFYGYARVWRGFIHIFLFLGLITVFLPGWARASGSALKALLFGPQGPGADWFWTALTFAAICLILLGPKTVYTAVERTIMVLVVVIVLGLILVAVRVGTLEHAAEMLRGLFNFGHIELDAEFPFHRFFAAVVYAGAGGLANLFYVYYLRDKQIGMGGRMPNLLNPLRSKARAGDRTGFIFTETSRNRARFKRWFRFVVLDQTFYFWLLNSFTMFLFMFGALAVLHPRGIVPDESQLVWDLAAMLTEVMGEPGRYLFLVIGMAALFSTQLGLVDGSARILTDMIQIDFSPARRLREGQVYLVMVLGIVVVGVVCTWLLDLFDVTALGFIFNSALIGGFAMAVYTPLTLYLNLRHLPPAARPGWLNICMVGIASLVYGGFALYCIWTEVVGLFG
jgi:hypothetical protein